MKRFRVIQSVVVLLAVESSLATVGVVKVGESLVDPMALTIEGSFGRCINGLSFQQDAVVSHKGYQYVAYYDGERHVCLARRRLPAAKWETIRFTDYDFKNNDAHNVISMGICPKDGTIHLAFDHHVHPLHYRVSRKKAALEPESVAWDASLFGPVRSELEKGKPISVTYPRFWQTPDEGLQFCYRRGGSGNGDRMLVDYDPERGIWKDTRQIDSGKGQFTDAQGTSGSRCSYPNGYTYGPRGRLHTTWVWRESSQGSNHDLAYCFSEDGGRTWLNNAAEVLAGPPSVNSPGITGVRIGREYGLMNTHGQAVDSRGRVHVVMWHCTDESLKAAGSKPGEQRWGPPEARRYFHYWRDLQGGWHQTQMQGVSGSRPKIFMDAEDNAYMIYAQRIGTSEMADGHLMRGGRLVIAAATAGSRWTDWAVIHTENGPFVNEMLGDPYRWRRERVLSVMVQESPAKAHEPTSLRILDFSFEYK